MLMLSFVLQKFTFENDCLLNRPGQSVALEPQQESQAAKQLVLQMHPTVFSHIHTYICFKLENLIYCTEGLKQIIEIKALTLRFDLAIWHDQ